MPFDYPNIDSTELAARVFLQQRQAALETSAPVVHFVTEVSVKEYDPRLLAKSVEEADRLFLDQLVQRWISETQWHSAMSRITGHPDFRTLTNFGPIALRFILERMNAGDIRVHWFPALKRISGEDPVPIEKRGFVGEMTSEWLKWGRAKRYLPS